MIVLIIKNAPQSLKGELSKYLIEISTGIFVGDLNAKIRNSLWERLIKYRHKNMNFLMLYSTNNEQGFSVKQYGKSNFEAVDYDGFFLFKKKKH